MINFTLLFLILGYMIVVYVIALLVSRYAAKNNKSGFLSIYFIGNRRLGFFSLALTIASTYASASSFMGGPGAAYKFGFSWVILAMIQVPAIFFSMMVIGRRIAYLANKYDLITVMDILNHTYNNRHLVILCSIALIISFFGIMSVQLIGGARLLQGAFDLDYKVSLLIFILSIAVYTFIGGFSVVVYTDVIQGLIMLVGSIILVVATVIYIGGLEFIVDDLNIINPDLLTFTSGDRLDGNFIISFWVLICIGLIGLPHTSVRAMSYGNAHSLYRGIIIATIVLTIIMFSLHFSAVLANIIGIVPTSPDIVLTQLMHVVLPSYIMMIVIVAPFAAIMSTVDSQLIQISATIVKDLILGDRNNLTDKMIKRIVSSINLILLLLLLLFSIRPPEMIVWINLLSFGILQSTFFWPIALGIFWQKASARGAIASSIVGLASYVFFTIINFRLFGMHQIVISLILSLIAFLIFNKSNFQQLRKQ